MKHNLHFARRLQRAAHPMERCPVYFLNHANTSQPHSCAPKLGGFRLPCGIPVSTEVEGNSDKRRRQAWPVNGKHLSHCGPLTPPCYAFSSFRSHDSGRLHFQKCQPGDGLHTNQTRPHLLRSLRACFELNFAFSDLFFL